MQLDDEIGFVRSVSTTDVPEGLGFKTVVFLEDSGQRYDVKTLTDEVLKSRMYWEVADFDEMIHGGVTISGVDPIYQHKFLFGFLQALGAHKIPVAVNTNLATGSEIVDQLFPFISLWMVNILQMDSQRHQLLTNNPNIKVLENIAHLDNLICKTRLCPQPRLRVRFLLIPRVNDDDLNIECLGGFVSKLRNLELLELIPFGSEIGNNMFYPGRAICLETLRKATLRDVVRVRKILMKYDIKVKY